MSAIVSEMREVKDKKRDSQGKLMEGTTVNMDSRAILKSENSMMSSLVPKDDKFKQELDAVKQTTAGLDNATIELHKKTAELA